MAGGPVLALDLATLTGWAVGRLRPPMTAMEAAVARPPQPLSGVRRVAETGAPVGRFLSQYELWLRGMISHHKPAGLIFEAPILASTTSVQTARKLMGLAGTTQKVAHERGIRWVREAQPSTIKKHFCGRGGPGKEGVIAACLARGWTFADDNEADALALWDFAAALVAKERQK